MEGGLAVTFDLVVIDIARADRTDPVAAGGH